MQVYADCIKFVLVVALRVMQIGAFPRTFRIYCSQGRKGDVAVGIVSLREGVPRPFSNFDLVHGTVSTRAQSRVHVNMPHHTYGLAYYCVIAVEYSGSQRGVTQQCVSETRPRRTRAIKLNINKPVYRHN